MAFRTALTTGGTHIDEDYMFVSSDSNFPNGYDNTTVPSNEKKITASDGASGDFFGRSVAVGNGRIVVGASSDDDNGSSSGSAYIYDLGGNLITKITASDGAGGDGFGISVAVGNGRIVVGADGDDEDSGSAYIFDLDGNELRKITASDGADDDFFGTSVAVGNSRIVVGAYEDDDNGSDSGSAYIYDLDGNFITKITASDGDVNDFFGFSVAVGSGRIVVGAYGDDIGISSFTGSAYIFDLDGNEITKITASDSASGDRFGISVAVGSGRIVVGSTLGDSNGSAGSAYIYDLDGNFITKITASDGDASDRFGISVAVGNGRIVVGAYEDDTDNGSFSGSAYIFDLDGNELSKITASDGDAGDRFGESIAVGSGRIVVGVLRDDTDNGSLSGSAYVYQTPHITHTLDII